MSMIIWKWYTISFGSFLVHFRFVRSFHVVPVFLDLACVRTDHTVHLDWLDGDFPRLGVPDCPVLSSLEDCHRWGCRGWKFARHCDGCFMVGHNVVDFKFMIPYVVPMHLRDWVGVIIELVWCLVDDLCIVWNIWEWIGIHYHKILVFTLALFWW